MKILPILALLISLTLAVNAQKRPEPIEHRFTGVIKDQNGAVIPGLLLEINGNRIAKSEFTDINGEFEILLPAGKWELTAPRIDRQNFRVTIVINEERPNPENVVLVVDNSWLCCTNASGNPYPKILKFPKSAYRPAAIVARARGQVVISLKIGKDGKVIEATADSGHPELIDSSFKEARNCVFEPSESEEVREAKITYYFILPNDKTPVKDVVRLKEPYTALIETGF